MLVKSFRIKEHLKTQSGEENSSNPVGHLVLTLTLDRFQNLARTLSYNCWKYRVDTPPLPRGMQSDAKST